MGRFTFRGGSGDTQLVQYDDNNKEISYVTIPQARMRSLGESIIEMADAQDALSEFFAHGGKPMDRVSDELGLGDKERSDG